ncbi:glycoside hydrolase family 127 protein [Mucilaginibacter sabulilitoris]|uniref:Glycoside hydrolase family 127 protein n=1 Tax=Mucilaginibacter sabulilitoris TaxID=1173583 RepID=A0ABZ0TGG5_9SPHI|nr:glycoside hydrolase family 127 protein [Mucilaginibacter sabulilitoris]WPU91891.1 glycoside hydrolase family 127 protein [Mucilaginibacter sabulilitoris]
MPLQARAQSSLQEFKLQQVTLLPSVFKNAQQTDMTYMLALDPDRLLAPYLREAGLIPKKKSYGNWENTGLDGHIGGHYLSALSNMYASTHNAELNRRLDYMLAQLKRCQDKTGSGYLGGIPGGTAMWKDIAAGKIEAEPFALNKKWVPLYNIHKLFAGLRDAYLIAGKTQAKEILVRLTDYIYDVSTKLTDEQIQTMLISEHGGLNEVFADVSVITGQDKYLTLARRFSHKAILNPLIQGQDELNGLHANMQIPKAVGFQRISEVGGDKDYGKAAEFFWETVVNNRTVVIGGNSVNEHFNPTGNFTKMITDVAGPETCNSYNMLKLTRHLFEKEGNVKYMDFYERVLYNHILSSQHPTHGGFVYYTSMRPRHYRVYSQPQEAMWCCVGSGMENHGKYAELIYSYHQKDLYVNLFIPSRLNWASKGFVLSQQTKFPDQETTQLLVEAVKPGAFTINIRYPHWVKPGALQIKINGAKVAVDTQPGTYVKLNRAWKKGDEIEVRLPMGLSTEALPDSSGYVAFLHGPIVLAAKTGTSDLDNLIGDSDQFGGFRARGKMYPLDSAPVLAANDPDLTKYLKPVNGKDQTFTAPDLISPASYKNLELIPFYKLHDARYMIYWHKGQLQASAK